MKKITDLKFDDCRTPEQRQIFYEGLSNEPSLREKVESLSQRNTKTEKGPIPLSGPNVRCFS